MSSAHFQWLSGGQNKLLFLLVALLVIASATATASPVILEPSEPVTDVPFLVTPPLAAYQTIYLSTSSACVASGLTPVCTIGATSAQNYNKTTCLFTVTRASLNLQSTATTVPTLYWCSNANANTPLGTFDLFLIRPIPLYAFYNVLTTLTFTPQTPVGTSVGFYTTSACTTAASDGGMSTLTATREIQWTFPNGKGNVVYVCAIVPTPYNNGATSLVPAGLVSGANGYSLTTVSGLRYRTTAVVANAIYENFSLSKSSNCVPLAQSPSTVVQSNAMMLSVTAPRGKYYFCSQQGAGVYVPAYNQFSVLEYGVSPNYLYTNMATNIELTMDAATPGITFENGLFSDAQCTTPVIGWSTTLTWTVPQSGTYYACVRQQNNPTTTTSQAGVVTVTAAPGVTFSRTPAVKGIGLIATVVRPQQPNGMITVGLSPTASCELTTNGTTTNGGTTAAFQVPLLSNSPIYYCVSTPFTDDGEPSESDEGSDGYVAPTPYYYALGQINLVSYALTYSPLRVATPTSIGLDPSVTFSDNSQMKLVPSTGSGCDATPAAGMQFPLGGQVQSLSPVTFPTAGTWLLCVSEPSVLNGEYSPLQSLSVYGDASMIPSGVVPGLTSSVAITMVPPNANMYFVTSGSCTGTALFATQSNANGQATATVLATQQGTLTLCVGFTGMSNSVITAAQVQVAGTITSANAVVSPTVVVSGVSSQLNFKVPYPSLLVGGVCYLTTGATCAAAIPAGVLQAPINAGANSGMPYSLFTFTNPGSTYTVCVGSTAAQNYVSAGTVKVVTPLTMTSNPETGIAGLPMTLTFSGNSFTQLNPNVFAVVDDATSCSDALTQNQILATGTIATSGVTSPFLIPEDAPSTIKICVGASATMLSATAGFTYGGTVDVDTFTSLSHFALVGQPNNLQGWPMGSGNALYITPCSAAGCTGAAATATCSTGTKYYTSTLLPLSAQAPTGFYYLCQQAFTPAAVVGANNTINVVTPWTLTTTENPIRQYKPFTVTLNNAANLPNGYTIHVQPATIPCSNMSAAGQSFTGNGASTQIEITDLDPVQNVIFCLQPDVHDSFQVMSATLYHYMTPATLVADQANSITSGMLTTGVSMISGSPACTSMISSATATINAQGQSSLTVNGCGTNSQYDTVYYCESSTGGANYNLRGSMGLLRPSGCPDGTPASIVTVVTAPAKAITNYGITNDVLVNPFLSTNHACTDKLPASVGTNGYSPQLNEVASFYVCANPIDDPTFIFTTTTPTMTVANWKVTPTSALSRFNGTAGSLPSTTMTINYATPTLNTFFSSSSTCASTMANAQGFSSAALTAVYSSTAINGLVYVCTADSTTNQLIPIADFLSVTPPNVPSITPAIIRGAPFSATLVVQAATGQTALYSMIPGTDTNYPYANMYVSTTRNVFLSSDACSTVLPTTSSTTVAAATNSVTFTTDDISQAVTTVSLCTGTPAGTAQAVTNIVVAPGNVFPTQFVTGTTSSIYIPLYRSTKFFLSQSNGDCSAISGTLPPFTTNADGYGSVVLVGTDGKDAALGTYTLCYTGGGNAAYTPLSTIQVVAPIFYNIQGLTYIVGVPGTMEMLNDLRTSYLYQGFSTTTDCSGLGTQYGSWTEVSSTSIVVSATAAINGLYLCARVPINGSIVSLPVGGPTINFFASSPVKPPSGGLEACGSSTTISSCYAPGTGTGVTVEGDTLAVIYGDCCNSLDQLNLLGKAPMKSGTCKLELSNSVAQGYPTGTEFTMCVFSTTNPGYCATLGPVNVSTDCKGKIVDGGSKLSTGWLIAIIILCVIIGLLLLALLIYLLWRCCRDEKGKEVDDRQLVALRQLEASEFEGPPELTNGSHSHSRHPLLYYPGGSSEGHTVESSQSPPAIMDGRSVSDSPPSAAVQEEEARSAAATMVPVDDEEAFEEPEVAPKGPIYQHLPIHLNLIENLEEDERDQIALEEARERYNLRLRFAEELERLKLQEKEDEVDIGYEDDASMVDAGAGRSAPRSQRSTTSDRESGSGADRVFLPGDEDDHQIVYDEAANVGMRQHVESERLRSEPMYTSLKSTPLQENRQPTRAAAMSEDGATDRDILMDGETSMDRTPIRSNTLHSTHHSSLQNSARRADPNDVPAAPARPNSWAIKDGYYTHPQHQEDEIESEYISPNRQRSVDVSPIDQSRGDGPAGDSAVLPMRFDNPMDEEGYHEDDDDYDGLSYTTTQRFYDENRFLTEEEKTRRQRLCNWEEEERAQLAQEELTGYMTAAHRQNEQRDLHPDEADEAPNMFASPSHPADLPALPRPPRGSQYGIPNSDPAGGLYTPAEEH